MAGKTIGFVWLFFAAFNAAGLGASFDPAAERYGETLPHSIYQEANFAPLAAPKVQVRTDTLAPHLRNGDFETTDSDGSLAAWKVFREGFVDFDPGWAYSGQQSVRSSFLFGWYQQLLPPVSPYQSFAIAGQAWREFNNEEAAIRSVFYDSNGLFLKEKNSFSPVAGPEGEYGEFWAAQEYLEHANSVEIYLRGRSPQSWIRFDDLTLYTEQFYFPDGQTGEPWEFSDGAIGDDGSSLVLPEGSSAAQRVVVGLENQAYFVWGRYEAAADAVLTVSETWHARDDEETAGTTSTMHQLLPPGGTFISDPGRLPGTASGEATVTLEMTSGGAVITSLRRGFAKVEPRILTAGPASPDGTLKLTAAWPEYLTTTSIVILSNAEELVASIDATLLGTTARAEWDPGATPSGNYIVRFTLEASDGETVTVNRPLTITQEPAASPVVPVFKLPDFARGIWIFTHRDATTSDTFRTIELARQDGFNFAVILCRTNQLETVRAAAELYNMPFVVFLPDAVTVFDEYEERTWFSKADYLSRIKELFAPVRDSAMFRGIYVMDEPFKPEEFETLSRAVLSIAQDGSLGVPFTTFVESVTPANLALVQPPTGFVDVYPYHLFDGRNSIDALLARVPVENQHAKTLAALGRDLWILPQGFTDVIRGEYYPVPPSMERAQLAALVLSGARGYLPFVYNANGSSDGLRGPGLAPTPKLAPYREFNMTMERIGPVVMSLDVPEIVTAPHPFAVSIAAGPGGSEYIHILNADDEVTRTLIISLASEPPSPVYDIVNERQLRRIESGAVEVELAPGGWALFNAGDNSIASLDALQVPTPSPSTLELPVTHQFTLTNSGGAAIPVRELEFDSDANTIAISGEFLYVPVEPMVYNLEPGGEAVRELGPPRFPAHLTGVAGDNLFSVSSPNLGVRFYPTGGFTQEPAAEYMGFTGGAWDTLRSGEFTLLSMSSMGMRQLYHHESGLVSVRSGQGFRGEYLDLFGPFSDGSVTVVVADFGVSNVKLWDLHEFKHDFEMVNRTDRNGAMNNSRLLAVPRHQYGVGLFQLNSNGEPTFVGSIATEALDAAAVAWVNDSVLAVADGAKAVRFYSVSGGDVTLEGIWRPPFAGSFYIQGLAAERSRIAIGLMDGRVMVADTQSLQEPTAAIVDWQLFME